MRLNIYTEKSKKSILKAIMMSEECKFKYLEPQVLCAAIINEGRALISYIFQSLHIEKIEFCREINAKISIIEELSENPPSFSSSTQAILDKSKEIASNNHCELIPIEFIFLAMIYVPSEVQNVFESFNISPQQLIDIIDHYRRNNELPSRNETCQEEPSYPTLDNIAIDLCRQAQNGEINKAIGRDFEIRKVIQILSRNTKNNPILVGEPGTGKTAIIEGLAHKIIEGDVPRELRNIRIYSLDLASIIAGASHMGEFEERLKSIINEVISSNGQVVLFIDEIHLLIGGGRSSGAMDAANILKPELARGKIKLIGTTTFEEYKRYIEQDKAFERRFQKIYVEEPDNEAALAILRGIRIRLEDFHKVRIKDEAIKAAVNLSVRYIQDRFLPDKAIDLLDEAASKMKISRSTSPVQLDKLRRDITTREIEAESLRRDNESNPEINSINEEISNLKEEENSLSAKWQSERALLEEIQTHRIEISKLIDDKRLAENQGTISAVLDLTSQIEELKSEINRLQETLQESENLLKPALDEIDIMEVINEWTGIPVTKLNEDETEKLKDIEEHLNKSVIGQDEAKVLVANAIRRNKLGFSDPNKPIGSFLFLGTTGVGKTELCKALSEFLFDSRDAFIRIDMSEYQQEHEVSKLFGAPPGYIGHEDGGQLTEAVRRKPYSIILFDEIEKAHPKVFETLLQVLDDGRMTDGKGRTINFKNTIIVMTSNLGHQIIYSTLQGRRPRRRPRVGYSILDEIVPVNDESIITDEKINRAKSLILSELKSKVAPEFINRIDDIIMFLPLTKDDIKRIVLLQLESLKKKLSSQGLNLNITPEAVDFLVKVGFVPEYGARPVKRAINSYLVDDLSLNLINGEINKDNEILISATEESLIFQNS